MSIEHGRGAPSQSFTNHAIRRGAFAFASLPELTAAIDAYFAANNTRLPHHLPEPRSTKSPTKRCQATRWCASDQARSGGAGRVLTGRIERRLTRYLIAAVESAVQGARKEVVDRSSAHGGSAGGRKGIASWLLIVGKVPARPSGFTTELAV